MIDKHPAEKAPNPPKGPSTREIAEAERRKAESAEVEGRHKNDGQKDHVGAR
jgi:hypothetical protein